MCSPTKIVRIYLFAAMQDRLERQQHETEQERARLQGLVTRLEKQLTDQARSLEQVHYIVVIVPNCLS